ncbi:MAG: DUF6293 family protein [Archaeoglobaceae archaeon]|uniref:Uncharacterized protein n=1 Tax=Archaeoglobus fulgidus TaxID=2234 RepID=A0A7J3M436_ARCFL
MPEFVHVIAVDSNQNAVLESVKTIGYPIHRAYIVYRKKEASKIAENLEDILKSLVETKILNFEDKNVFEITWGLLRLMREEMEKGNEVLLNMSDADKNLAVAFLLSAQVSRARVYMMLDSKAEFVQTPPAKTYNQERIRILKILSEEGGVVESINRLIELLEGRTEDQKKYMAQRAKITYHLNELAEDNLVVTQRKGKNLKVMLTELGKAYVIMFG